MKKLFKFLKDDIKEDVEFFKEIKGTPYYYRNSSRKILFQCLSILLKDKKIPFSVSFSYRPSLEKRRIFQLRNPTISYQYNP